MEDAPKRFDAFDFSGALKQLWFLLATVDGYIAENKPWTLGESQEPESRAKLAKVLYNSAEALRIVTVLVHPLMPESTAKIWTQLGLGDIREFALSGLQWGQLKPGTKIGDVEPVFPRADKSAIGRMQKMEEEGKSAPVVAENKAAAAPASAPEAKPAAPAADGRITIDDFAKVELRVALVKVAERVPNADKLLRLEVDLGDHTRQILAGIAETYPPEALVGRKIIIVANLQPRKMRGLVSDGMLLAASLEGGKPVLAGFLEEVPVGAKLK
jgi:methionyl-tRNA synthetase